MRRFNRGFILKAICYPIIAFFVLGLSVQAQSWQDNVYLNGFFTLDLTSTDEDLAIVSATGQMREYEDGVANGENSLVGAQLEYSFNEKLSAFVQGSASFNRRGSLTSDIDWAYLSYDFGADLLGRAGKFQTPFLQGIELRNIGYSRTWARPLAPSSGASGFNHFYGVELLKHIARGDHNWDFQLSLGEAEHGLEEVDNKNMKLLSARYQRQQFWLRTALMHAEYSVFTPRKQIITDSGEVLMASMEAEATINDFVLNLGYSTSRSDVTPDDTMSYLSLAYQFGDFMPYIFTVSRNQFFVAFDIPAPLPPIGGGPPGQAPGNQPPPMAPPSPPDGDSDIDSLAIGARWNVSQGLALKVQLEKIKVRDAARAETGVIAIDGNAFTLVFEGAF